MFSRFPQSKLIVVVVFLSEHYSKLVSYVVLCAFLVQHLPDKCIWSSDMSVHLISKYRVLKPEEIGGSAVKNTLTVLAKDTGLFPSTHREAHSHLLLLLHGIQCPLLPFLLTSDADGT